MDCETGTTIQGNTHMLGFNDPLLGILLETGEIIQIGIGREALVDPQPNPQTRPLRRNRRQSIQAEALRLVGRLGQRSNLEGRVNLVLIRAGALFLSFCSMDQFIHGWDLAKAIGQDTTLDPQMAQICYGMCVPDMADQGREAGVIGAVVAVPDNASIQDKLLGYMGRQP